MPLADASGEEDFARHESPATRGFGLIQLRAEVAELLASVPPSRAVSPKALIVPHAGYIYSGRVAATAFAPLRGRASAIERVVVIGPAHYIAVRRIASSMPSRRRLDGCPWIMIPLPQSLTFLSWSALTVRTHPSTLWRSSCRSCKRC
jgi:hypothetical protein